MSSLRFKKLDSKNLDKLKNNIEIFIDHNLSLSDLNPKESEIIFSISL